ncbi:Leucine carboxyl methyltransferase 1 [Fasciolopsis buskii]|uniref:[phosphatase 2A protein]-leucine-carboxy methyltransferase n=1 Tax=Fasciolopsis buskii TaxID=27845 RepID=A0A8E0RK69_9TREM|nr:Leucine carboxyl methyltransferase 1 [Fasciolopsis buski]
MDVPSDQVIQGTNDDATASKLHAVNRGYWSDSFIRYFCFSKVSKSPEISRGYFVRTQAFKAITMSFIKHNRGQCQVVNLGAGSDTLYFVLREANSLPRKFIEVDLGYNVMRKIGIMRNRKLFPDSEMVPGQFGH